MKASGILAVMVSSMIAASEEGWSQAPAWKPEKTVEIVIGTTPGGPQDRQGRLLQRVLQDRKLVEHAVTVVNKPGGGSAVGLAYVAQHPGDGHFMQIVAQPLLSNHVAGRSKVTYTDFSPLVILAVEYVTLVVRPDSPIKDAEWVKDLEHNLMANAYKGSADTFKHWQREYSDVKALFVEMGLAK